MLPSEPQVSIMFWLTFSEFLISNQRVLFLGFNLPCMKVIEWVQSG